MSLTASSQDQKTRLQAIRTAERLILTCQERRHLTNYQPLQVKWNNLDMAQVAEKGYISLPKPDELADYAGRGVRQIHLHGGVWSYTGSTAAYNESELRRFINDAHQVRLKTVLYISTGYIDVRAPEYSQLGDESSWAVKCGARVTDLPLWDCARACVYAPAWRACLLAGVEAVFTRYGADGIYIDPGYWEYSNICANHPRHIHAITDEAENWATYEALLAEIGDIVRRHGGTFTLHSKGGHRRSHDRLWRYPDYWLIGEGESIDYLDQRYRPDVYTMIWTDNRLWDRGDALYAAAIPRLQFPYLIVGNMDMRGFAEQEQSTWQRYASLYSAMTGGCGVYYRQVETADFFKYSKLPHGLLCGVFCNEKCHLAITNRSPQTIRLELTQTCPDVLTGQQSPSFDIEPGALRVLLWPVAD